MRTLLFISALACVVTAHPGQHYSADCSTTTTVQSLPTALPLNLTQVATIFNRDKITNFTFPQPPRQSFKLLDHTEGPANIPKPGLPVNRDITYAPDGQSISLNRSAELDPLYIYPPDTRRNFKDTTYPWRAIGRVVSASKQGAGALIGSRLMVTASHVVDWNVDSNGDIGWLRFDPDFYDTDVFPPSYCTQTWSYKQLDNPNGEYDIAEDYAVCVLDRAIGDELGYLGFKTYDGSWDNLNVWAHVGYPGDVGGGNRPAYEGGFSIANSWSPGFFQDGPGLDIETFASLTHGDSGGPIFGFWDDGPYLVGVVSAEGTLAPIDTVWNSRTANWIAGGDPLSQLIAQLRNQFP